MQMEVYTFKWAKMKNLESVNLLIIQYVLFEIVRTVKQKHYSSSRNEQKYPPTRI